jgi:hypothetical protein
MVSFGDPRQMSLVADACQSFAFDNGAFGAWRAGKPIIDWGDYYDFVREWDQSPGFDFALMPDVIDGTEQDNDELLQFWPNDVRVESCPVWHLHESLDRLETLCGNWSRVALGSSGEYAQVGTKRWWNRMAEAMTACCDSEGRPMTKLHGLRMLDPKVFTMFPFASADSTNVARNIGIDQAWTGSYLPTNKAGRGIVIADRIEAFNSARFWEAMAVQDELEFAVSNSGTLAQ